MRDSRRWVREGSEVSFSRESRRASSEEEVEAGMVGGGTVLGGEGRLGC